jgi:hypothetical protein
MPATVETPETQTFRLERLDARQGVPEEEKTTVTIRLATIRQNTQRAKLFSEFIRELANTEEQRSRERVIFNFSLYELIEEETYLTLVGCNMTNGAQPLFRFRNSPQGQVLDMTREQFAAAWGLLDDDTAAEIHSKVLDVNSHWVFGLGPEEANLGE